MLQQVFSPTKSTHHYICFWHSRPSVSHIYRNKLVSCYVWKGLGWDFCMSSQCIWRKIAREESPKENFLCFVLENDHSSECLEKRRSLKYQKKLRICLCIDFSRLSIYILSIWIAIMVRWVVCDWSGGGNVHESIFQGGQNRVYC